MDGRIVMAALQCFQSMILSSSSGPETENTTSENKGEKVKSLVSFTGSYFWLKDARRVEFKN